MRALISLFAMLLAVGHAQAGGGHFVNNNSGGGGGGTTPNLQAVATQGSQYTGATSQGTAFRIGNGTDFFDIWCDVTTHICYLKAPTTQDIGPQLGPLRAFVVEDSTLTDLFRVDSNTHKVEILAGMTLDASLSAASVPCKVGAGINPTANGTCGYDTTANRYKIGVNGATKTLAHTDEISGGGGAAKCGVIDCVAPVPGNFTGINMSGATLDTSLPGTLYLKAGVGSSATTMALQVIAAPATPYTVTLAFRPNFGRDFNTCGLAIHLVSSGATRVLWPMQYTTGMHLKLTQFSALAGAGSDVLDISNDLDGDVFLRLTNNGTSQVWSYSNNNGAFFETVLSEATGTGLTPDRVGIACAAFNTTYPAAALLRHFHVQ